VCHRAAIQAGEYWSSCGLPASAWPGARSALERYRRLIAEHNAEAGLTAIESAEGFYVKHVADSLSLLRALPGAIEGASSVADVGAGAGLPGVVLAVALPGITLTAVESNRRKAAFVALATKELGLGGRVEVVARRSRELGHDPRYARRFDLVVARAVAPSAKLIRDCRLLIADGGSAALYKTPAGVSAELDLARREADRHAMIVRTSGVIELPGGAGRRQFIQVLAPAAGD